MVDLHYDVQHIYIIKLLFCGWFFSDNVVDSGTHLHGWLILWLMYMVDVHYDVQTHYLTMVEKHETALYTSLIYTRWHPWYRFTAWHNRPIFRRGPFARGTWTSRHNPRLSDNTESLFYITKISRAFISITQSN